MVASSVNYCAHCTLHTAHRTLHTAQGALHIAHCTLHTTHCTLHTAHSPFVPYTSLRSAFSHLHALCAAHLTTSLPPVQNQLMSLSLGFADIATTSTSFVIECWDILTNVCHPTICAQRMKGGRRLCRRDRWTTDCQAWINIWCAPVVKFTPGAVQLSFLCAVLCFGA